MKRLKSLLVSKTIIWFFIAPAFAHIHVGTPDSIQNEYPYKEKIKDVNTRRIYMVYQKVTAHHYLSISES